MKPTRASDQGRKPRNSNQKPRKLQMPNQLSVQLPLVNEADTYPTNLITKGKMAGKPVRLVLDTGASVSAIKEEVLKEIYGHVPLSAVQTAKDNLLRKTIILLLYLKENQFPCEFRVVQNLAFDAILGRDPPPKPPQLLSSKLRDFCFVLAFISAYRYFCCSLLVKF